MDSITYYGLLGVSDLKVAVDMLEPFLQPSSLELITGKKNLILACAHFLYFGYVSHEIVHPDFDEEDVKVLNKIFSSPKPIIGHLGFFMSETWNNSRNMKTEHVKELLRLHRGEITQTKNLPATVLVRHEHDCLDLISMPGNTIGYPESWFKDLHDTKVYQRRSQTLDLIFKDKYETFKQCVRKLRELLDTRKPFEYSDEMDRFIEGLDQICLQWNQEETTIQCDDWEELLQVVKELEQMVQEIHTVLEEIRERGHFMHLFKDDDTCRILEATANWFEENGEEYVCPFMPYRSDLEVIGFELDVPFDTDHDIITEKDLPNRPSSAKKHKK